jgi:NMD protein affecting ribosome stability and mRNA decay
MEKLSVVFDLDETLVTVKQNTQKANFVMSVKIRDGNIIKVGRSHAAGSLLQTIPGRNARENP